MSLREGNDAASGFRTRIPLPTRKPASALAAATANVVTCTTTRASASDVKIALANASKQTRGNKENDGGGRAGNGRGAVPHLGTRNAKNTTPTVLTHHATSGTTVVQQTGESHSVVTQTLTQLDPEYESLLATKLSTKDTKFDFKAQLTVAKEFHPRAKTLLKHFRGVILDIAGAVDAARVESADEIQTALVAAEDALKDRDETSQLLEAARAEAMKAAGEASRATNNLTESSRALKETQEKAAALTELHTKATSQLEALTKDVNQKSEHIAGLSASLEASNERVVELSKATEPLQQVIDQLQQEKAQTHETLGTLRGERSAAEAQLEAAKHAALEYEKEKHSETEKANKLHGDLARAVAEREGVTEQLASAREEAAIARAAAAEANVATAEAKSRASRLEDAAEHAASDLARARSDFETAGKRLDEVTKELTRVTGLLAVAETRAESVERDFSNAETSHKRELNALRDELSAAKAHRAALEPRVETLGAELAEARADAKVAKAESEYLRKAGDEARERGVSSESERLHAEKHLGELKESMMSLEQSIATSEVKVSALQSEVSSNNDKIQRLESELESESKKRSEAERDASDAQSLKSRLEALRVTHEEQSNALASARRELSETHGETAAQKSKATEKENTAKTLRERCEQLEELLKSKDAELRQNAIVRRALHNQVQELKGNIRVFCRVRPVCGSENFRSIETGAGLKNDQALLSIPTVGEKAGQLISLIPPGKEKPFEFSYDRVFDSTAGQSEVFEDISHLVQSALDGYKVCIFAYGQTGSGKTYTMLGDNDVDSGEVEINDVSKNKNRGLIPRCMEQIFDARDYLSQKKESSSTSATFAVTATMVEVYNEEIKDLLDSKGDTKHEVKHCLKSGDTTVTHLKSVEVKSVDEITKLMTKAQAARTTASTKMNDHSSRSHMVFTIKLTGEDISGRKLNGVLNLVDLAGSERLSRTGATGDRLKEAQSINKSLSALGDVISALAEKQQHIPYRNSKLTYLLQSSLGGDSKTLMVANVAGNFESSQETLCSLRFAQKVNSCAVGGTGKK